MVLIGGLQKSSLIDYPGKISAIIFTQGCNFNCPYCHNPELVDGRLKNYDTGFILEFLKSRIGKLDGVVITGGEPTLHKNLPDFIRQIKDLGFFVKLDTNGTNPEMLQRLIDEKLVNYVAMDIKSSIEKYAQVVCTSVNTEDILKSVKILKSSNIEFEFRTTVVKSQLKVSDFYKIAEVVKGAKRYYLQKFLQTKTLNDSYMSEHTYKDEEFEGISEIFNGFVKKTEIR